MDLWLYPIFSPYKIQQKSKQHFKNKRNYFKNKRPIDKNDSVMYHLENSEKQNKHFMSD